MACTNGTSTTSRSSRILPVPGVDLQLLDDAGVLQDDGAAEATVEDRDEVLEDA